MATALLAPGQCARGYVVLKISPVIMRDFPFLFNPHADDGFGD